MTNTNDIQTNANDKFHYRIKNEIEEPLQSAQALVLAESSAGFAQTGYRRRAEVASFIGRRSNTPAFHSKNHNNPETGLFIDNDNGNGKDNNAD